MSFSNYPCEVCQAPTYNTTYCAEHQVTDTKALNMIAEAEIDIIGPTCEVCRGVKATDTTPGWVYKKRDICECEGE